MAEQLTVAITGSSGLIGQALVASLLSDGHRVLRLVRREASTPDEVRWDPQSQTLDPHSLVGVDAVVNLAGAGVGDHRWTNSYKREILSSRTNSTRTIATTMAQLDQPPRVLVAGSAIGYYGDSGDRVLDETAPVGRGFLADVVQQWEASAAPASDAGIRVTFARTGLVLAGRGGAWARMWPLFKLGLGGKLGSGRQWWSWISLRDEVRALRFLIEQDDAQGVFNLTGPNPVTNEHVTRAMGEALGRPTFASVPSIALKAALGEFSSDVLGSQRVTPTRLLDAGFTFLDETVEAAIRTALASQ